MTIRFWGKTNTAGKWRPLQQHCLDVAAVVAALLEEDKILQQRLARLAGMPFKGLRPWLLFFAALHDLGKFSLPFQEQNPELARRLGVPHWGRHSDVHHPGLGLLFWLKKHPEILNKLLPACSQEDLDALQHLADASFGHHGAPVAAKGTLKVHFKGVMDETLAFAGFCAELFLQDASRPPQDGGWSGLSWLWAGCMVIADWIGSNELWFPLADDHPEKLDLAACWRKATKTAKTAVAECGVLHPRAAEGRTFASLLPQLASVPPRPLQLYALEQAVTDADPQLHIFEDLTGSGKTEAALLCAHGIMASGGASGFYVGLPTMATANAMYQRMARDYRALFHPMDQASLMLSHSARSIHEQFLKSVALQRQGAPAPRKEKDTEDGAATCAAWLADHRKKSLLAACGVGSLDQALLAVLPARHQCLRMVGLSRLVLIADEVHAYDHYTFHILSGLLEYQALTGGSAIILTATLPKKRRQQLCDAFAKGLGGQTAAPVARDAFPLATRVSQAGSVEEFPIAPAWETPRRTSVELTHDEEAMYAALLKARQAGACSCWIRNTVDQAVDAWRELLRRGVPPQDVTLFHARFTGSDRARIEEQVLRDFGKDSGPEQRKGRIVIATQVIEQSIDCDFDMLLSDLAPMDLLIQRAGRCCRHERGYRPKGYASPHLLVLSPEPVAEPRADWYASLLGNAQYVYPMQSILWRTARLLQQEGAILLPNRARHLLEGAYGQLEAPTVLEEADQTPTGEDMAKKNLADQNTLALDQGYCTTAARVGWAPDILSPTRLGQETIQLRLCRLLPDGTLCLWAGADASLKTCLGSEVCVSAHKARHEAEQEPQLQQALDTLRSQMPDKAKWSLLLPLQEEHEAGVWRGFVEDSGGERREVEYRSETGLHIAPEKDLPV